MTFPGKFLLSRGETSDQNLMEDSRTLLMVSSKNVQVFFWVLCLSVIDQRDEIWVSQTAGSPSHHRFRYETDLMTWMIRGTPILGNLQIPDSFILIRNQWYFGTCLVF